MAVSISKPGQHGALEVETATQRALGLAATTPSVALRGPQRHGRGVVRVGGEAAIATDHEHPEVREAWDR